MRGAGTLIPARFLTLLSHLCVLIILLWDSKLSVQHCFPKPHHDSQFQIYHSRLVSGLAASVGLLVIELVTFIMGLTMFCGSVSLTSIGSHGIASVALAYFILGGWNCDWFWPVFIMSSVLPCTVDIAAAAYNLCLLNQ